MLDPLTTLLMIDPLTTLIILGYLSLSNSSGLIHMNHGKGCGMLKMSLNPFFSDIRLLRMRT